MAAAAWLATLVLVACPATTFAAEARDARGGVANAGIQRVVTMLDNLLSAMSTEQEQDDKMHQEFQAWCQTQQAATAGSIESLQGSIEELSAMLSKLSAQKGELDTQLSALNEHISEVQGQIQVASDKRSEEHATFVTEQQNFDTAIAACGRAVEVLKSHYGDPEPELKKPSWMGLSQETVTILRRTVLQQKMVLKPSVAAFLQIPSSDRYTDKRSESMNIVSQMQELAETFRTDKQSGIDEENGLQGMFDKLMTEKTADLNTLTFERDTRQKVLNQVNEGIATNEGAKSAAEMDLTNEQAYLQQITKSCGDEAQLYEMRTQDRTTESTAVSEAKKVLTSQLAFVETDKSTHHMQAAGTGAAARVQHHSASVFALRGRRAGCAHCDAAAALLTQSARTYSSEVLAVAAATVLQNDALADVIRALDGLVSRLHADQDMEDQHKHWCESELSDTNTKKAHHEGVVTTLEGNIADLIATVSEKTQAIEANAEAVENADTNFQQATTLRNQEHSDFKTEQGNYAAAISALNEAIGILAKFYAQNAASSAASLAQAAGSSHIAPREIAPGVFSDVYERKGGAGVVQMISTVRQEFEQGKADLEAAEKQTAADYEATQVDYQAARRDLVSQGDRLTVEKQTALGELDQARQDKDANEQEIIAAQSYLAQLGGSCHTLLDNYDKRKNQRSEEESAILQAKKVLAEEA